MDNSENYCIYTNIPYSKLKDREETIEYSENYCIYTNIPYSIKSREGQFTIQRTNLHKFHTLS